MYIGEVLFVHGAGYPLDFGEGVLNEHRGRVPYIAAVLGRITT